jgi:hypothetical protein
VDWTVLVDGIANPKHLEVARETDRIVKSLGARPPGQEKIFGNLAISHQIIHQIGGEDDTNSNTTKRILLVLESRPVGRRDAFDRVLNSVLSRYIMTSRVIGEPWQWTSPINGEHEAERGSQFGTSSFECRAS